MTIYVEEDGHSPSAREFRLRFGFFKPGQVLADALIRARLRARHTPSWANVSMGPLIDRRDLGQQPSGSVLKVYESAEDLSSAALTGSTSRASEAPLEEILYSSLRPVLQGQIKTGGKRMALDLGNIITQLGEQYINTRWGGGSQNVTYVTENGSNPLGGNGVGTDQVPLKRTMAGGPLVGLLRGPFGFRLGSSASKIAGYLGSALAGVGAALTAEEIAQMASDLSKVKCKRRRRRLATLSDIKDLAALSAVLGKGKLLETWVATRRI